MDRALYVAMTGAKQTMTSQAINSHNLANATTTGFKADLDLSESQLLDGVGYPSRIYNLLKGKDSNLAAGSVQSTGRELDIAMADEDAWIAVQAPDGSEAYTRAGDLRINSLGILTNGVGHIILGNQGPMAIPPAEKIEIATDGTISVRALGQDVRALVTVDRIKLVKLDAQQIEKGNDGLFRLSSGATAPADASVRLINGATENSNVNAVGAMVRMIELARHFEMQVKIMRTAGENETQLTQLMRIG